MRKDWRPGNVHPYTSTGSFGGYWNTIRGRIPCSRCRRLIEGEGDPRWRTCGPCTEEIIREKRKTGELKPKEKPKKKRKKSWTQKNPKWRRLKNLTMAEWKQEKRKQAEQEKKGQAENADE